MPFGGLLPHCSLFFIVCLRACLICLPAFITIACYRTVDRPEPSFVQNHHGAGSWVGLRGCAVGRLMPFSGGSGVGAGTPRTVGGAARGSTHGVGANTRTSAHPTTSGRHKIHCRLFTIYACVILTPPLLPYCWSPNFVLGYRDRD